MKADPILPMIKKHDLNNTHQKITNHLVVRDTTVYWVTGQASRSTRAEHRESAYTGNRQLRWGFRSTSSTFRLEVPDYQVSIRILVSNSLRRKRIVRSC